MLVIYTLLEDFKEAYKDKKDNLILQNYSIDEGIYIKIDKNQNITHFIKKKKEDSLEEIVDWFKHRDFLSKYISSNKCIQSSYTNKATGKKSKSKLIHSNNYLSWFVKKETFLEIKDNTQKEELKDITTGYYDYFLSKDLNKKDIIDNLDSEFDEEKYNFCKNYMTNNLDKISEYVDNYKDEFNKYIKVFFDYDIKTYERESNRYVYHNIYADKKIKHIKHDNKSYAPPSFNMNVNNKKPFLRHKTMKVEYPFRVDFEDALILYKYSIWLKNQGSGKKLKPYNFDYKTTLSNCNLDKINSNHNNMYINIGFDRNGAIINDFDIIPKFKRHNNIKIENKLEKTIKDEQKDYINYKLNEDFGLETLIDELLFNKNLKKHYKSDKKDIKPNKFMSKGFCNTLVLSIDMIFDYFYKGIEKNLYIFNEKYTKELLKDGLKNKSFNYLIDCMNIYLSIKDYFEGVDSNVKIKDLKNNLVLKLNDENSFDFDNEVEYSFAAGQIAYYILSKSKSHKKTHDKIDPLINKKRVKDVNRELKFWFKKYAYTINQNDKKFNKIFSMIMAYDNEASSNEDMFLAGYLSDNIMYTRGIKNEEE